ncbi:ArsR/SmtB family transcription factor [Isoptericola cucumis]|uniref:Transcriptional regulator n=1 Tax=Isoptericola cucumis TaxID=1776856 RepID=A0ABQ2B7J3_9MICO|nr:helix-turn-helix domain-containing protein [Isoptericola cucumis]GGI09494.1 transcriptional regulator [Isoptericola cucumis]
MDQEPDPTAPAAREVRTVTEAKALAALAHPYRARIVDALKVDGPSTTSAIARRTGQAVGSASHHLRALLDAGLVDDAPELAKNRRERVWRLVSPGVRWSRREFADDPAAVAAAHAAEALHLQRQFERTRTWLGDSESAPEWDDTAFATQRWLHLSPAELAELGAEVEQVLARWSRRELPDDGAERESVLVFARGFPAQP